MSEPKKTASTRQFGPDRPEHETVYCRIRDMVLFGELKPGEAVTIHGMTAATGTGMMPVREAIRRLTAEGALESHGNRRVSIPRITPEKLDEIYFVRLYLEPYLAEIATEKLDEDTISALEWIDDQSGLAIQQGDVKAYLRNNFDFHHALYSAAGADVLLKIVVSLWLQVGPALRVVCGRFGTSNLPDMHEEAIRALRRRDAKAVAAAIKADISQGMDMIRQTLTDH